MARTDAREPTPGMLRHQAHNRELHQQAHIRRHGGYQWGLPLGAEKQASPRTT